MNMTPALNFHLAREHDKAVEELQKVLQMEPNFVAARSVMGSALLQKGLCDEALAEYEKVLELIKGAAQAEAAVKAFMAYACALCGKQSEAHALLDEITLARTASPYSIAGVHGALGDADSAFAWLDKAFEQRDVQLVSLKVDPFVDSIRQDHRFHELVNRVGLP